MFIYLLTYMYSKYVPDVIGGCLFEIKLGQPDCFYCQRGEYHKMAISIVNMTMHNFIKFGFPRQVNLWNFVPHYPSPPAGRRYALGLQRGGKHTNPLAQFLLIVHTTHANSGWECPKLWFWRGC